MQGDTLATSVTSFCKVWLRQNDFENMPSIYADAFCLDYLVRVLNPRQYPRCCGKANDFDVCVCVCVCGIFFFESTIIRWNIPETYMYSNWKSSSLDIISPLLFSFLEKVKKMIFTQNFLKNRTCEKLILQGLAGNGKNQDVISHEASKSEKCMNALFISLFYASPL